MKNNNINYSLYLITHKILAGKRSIYDTVNMALKGGVTVVQYREKEAAISQMIREASRLHEITQKAGVPLIINDRIDIALGIEAEGIHVGQDDLSVVLARKLLGLNKIVGVTVRTVTQAIKAESEGADYLGVGDIFGSSTKKGNVKPIGLGMIKKISEAVRIPIIGIGGITPENAKSVIEAGAYGLAVISAIMGQPDPEKAAKKLRRIVDKELDNE